MADPSDSLTAGASPVDPSASGALPASAVESEGWSEAVARPGAVEATERIMRSLFSGAVGYTVFSVLWGVVIAPFNAFSDHHARSLALGAAALLASLVLAGNRDRALRGFKLHPALLVGVAAVGVALLWADGGWRSSFYLASYSAIVLAAVAASLEWAFVCAFVLAVGYILGLAVNGYTWSELQGLKDADSVVANFGGYFIAAFFFGAPVRWLGGYVVRMNQIFGQDSETAADTSRSNSSERPKHRTAALSVREVEVACLVAQGLTNDAIAAELTLSPHTVQNHVRNARKKTGASNRAELGALAVTEGLMRPPGSP